jgi:coenzyme F420-0:L-glutamate ligase
MIIYALKTNMVKTGDNIVDVVLEAIKNANLALEDNDIIALASKIIAHAEGRIVRLDNVKPSKEAEKLAKKYSLQPELAELILHEADKIYGGVEKAILTLKNGVLAANAGIDNKNAPAGHAILWPKDPKKSAKEIRDEIENRTSKKVGVLIVDSSLIPLRIGTVGLALAITGFKPIKDHRGKKDIFGRQIVITRHAIADDLACVAHFLMGEASERIPIVLIRGAQVEFDEGVYGGADMMMPIKECIFMKTFLCGFHE